MEPKATATISVSIIRKTGIAIDFVVSGSLRHVQRLCIPTRNVHELSKKSCECLQMAKLKKRENGENPNTIDYFALQK